MEGTIILVCFAVAIIGAYVYGKTTSDEKYLFSDSREVEELAELQAETQQRLDFALKQIRKHDQFYIDQKEIDEDF